MAKQQVLTDLVLRISEDAAELRKGMKTTRKQMSGFQKQMKQLQTIVIAAFSIDALVGFAQKLGVVYKETQKVNRTIKQLTGESGGAMNRLSAQASALAKTFDQDLNKVIEAANVLSKQMNVEFGAALDTIEQGFLSGANASDELLDIIKEYPTFLREGKFSLTDFQRLINAQVKQGIFSDKGIDSIKEAVIRLREMPQATKDALEAIGISANEMQRAIASGQKSLRDAIIEVSNTIKELPEDSQKVGQAVADIFGGAGEDAGIQWVSNIENALNTLPDTVADVAAQMNKKLLEAQKEFLFSISAIVESFQSGENELLANIYKLANSFLEALFYDTIRAAKISAKPVGLPRGSTTKPDLKGQLQAAPVVVQPQSVLPKLDKTVLKQYGDLTKSLASISAFEPGALFTPDQATQLTDFANGVSNIDNLMVQMINRAEQVKLTFSDMTTVIAEDLIYLSGNVMTMFGAAIGETLGGVQGSFERFAIGMIDMIQNLVAQYFVMAAAAGVAGEIVSKGLIVGLAVAAVGLAALSAFWKSKVSSKTAGAVGGGGVPTRTTGAARSQTQEPIEIYGVVRGEDIYFVNNEYGRKLLNTT